MPRSRPCLLSVALGGVLGAASTAPAVAFAFAQDDVAWTSIQTLRIEGRGFADTLAPFDRLPAKAQSSVRAQVWKLSRHASGIVARFVTDASRIDVRWTLTSSELALPHMPATGVSGLDLYVRDTGDRGRGPGRDRGRWRWLATARPTAFPDNRARLVDGVPGEEREYALYLPLYNGVSAVELGVAETARLRPGPERPEGLRAPVVYYGTSITQGGCASRPGMSHPAILGRRLDRPLVNLGFSGNGRMEIELADLLGEIDAAVYVLDCLPNMTGDTVRERAVPFVRRLRELRPATPILLVEDRSYQNAFLVGAARARNQASRAALRAGFEALVDDGVAHLHYLAGAALLGDDGDATVDGSHPTDLGFVRQADAFEPVLRAILAR